MNGDRTFGKVIPYPKMREAMSTIYNKWWLKWKDKMQTEEDFMNAMRELDPILELGEEYPVIKHMAVSLLYDLDARLYGGYTETTRSKILSIIEVEKYGT